MASRTADKFNGFRGAAKRLEDIDISRIAATIGVGEDELHAFMDVESRGSGFDGQGRPKILFEPHLFYRNVPKAKRARAISEGLACQKWGQVPYGTERGQYERLKQAMQIDATAALKSCSWGLCQVLGSNHEMVGYDTVDDFVLAMMDDEDNHLEAAVEYIKAAGIDDDLRAHRWDVVARVYNGPGYAKNGYHIKMRERFKWWQSKKDTPWSSPIPAPEGTSEVPGRVVPSAPEKPANDPQKPALAPYEIEAIQKRLRDLGYYQVGKVDGVWGPSTVGAIMALQTVAGIKADGAYNERTKAALADDRSRRPISEERANTTVDDLRQQGSETIRQADGVVTMSSIITWVSAIAALITFLNENWGAAEALVAPFRPMLGDLPAWSYPIPILLAGIYMWLKGRGVRFSRLEAERTGLHNGEPDPAPSPP